LSGTACDSAAARSALLADFSLDITAKELGELEPARTVIPAGTPVQLSFPDGADLAERASTARAIKEAGFTPVPIIAARRFRSQQMLREYLAALGGDVITQFGFDAARVLGWLTEARARGIGLQVRVSVPGPATVRRLLAIASRCGVAVSASVAEEYGFSLTEPTHIAEPGRFIQTLASGYDPRSHGDVKLHFNAFGGFSATVEWIESRIL